MNAKNKIAKQLERHFKGAANHYRIGILLFLEDSPDSTLDDIVKELSANTKTISAHTGKLMNAGLINKKHKGLEVLHLLYPCGERFCRFIKTFSYSRE